MIPMIGLMRMVNGLSIGINPTLNNWSYLMNRLQELLTITMEECGELIQECSKILLVL